MLNFDKPNSLATEVESSEDPREALWKQARLEAEKWAEEKLKEIDLRMQQVPDDIVQALQKISDSVDSPTIQWTENGQGDFTSTKTTKAIMDGFEVSRLTQEIDENRDSVVVVVRKDGELVAESPDNNMWSYKREFIRFGSAPQGLEDHDSFDPHAADLDAQLDSTDVVLHKELFLASVASQSASRFKRRAEG